MDGGMEAASRFQKELKASGGSIRTSAAAAAETFSMLTLMKATVFALVCWFAKANEVAGLASLLTTTSARRGGGGVKTGQRSFRWCLLLVVKGDVMEVRKNECFFAPSFRIMEQ